MLVPSRIPEALPIARRAVFHPANVHLSPRPRLLSARPRSDSRRDGADAGRQRLQHSAAMAACIHRGQSPTCRDAHAAWRHPRRTRPWRVEPACHHRLRLRPHGSVSHSRGRDRLHRQCAHDARRSARAHARPHGALRLPAFSPAEIPRPAPQRRQQLPRRVRFAERSGVLQQRIFHLPKRSLARHHVCGDVVFRLGHRTAFAPRRPIHAVRDLPLCETHPRPIDHICGEGKRRAHRRAGRPQLDQDGAGLRSRGL